MPKHLRNAITITTDGLRVSSAANGIFVILRHLASFAKKLLTKVTPTPTPMETFKVTLRFASGKQ